MPRWRTKAFFLAAGAGALALGVTLPALGAPESLLPPGFGRDESQPLRPADPQPSDNSAPAASAPALPTDADALSNLASDDSVDNDQNSADVELPDSARRSIDEVGSFTPANGGMGADAFAGSNGQFLSILMRRLNAPIASRWLSITLRRALMTRVPTPAGVDPADWVAERAWLLLRMGEADAARMLIQQVDVDRYTPKMFSVAQQIALATADPAALCPIADGAMRISDEPAWSLAKAMCAGLSGDGSTAMMLVDRAKQKSHGRDIDILLAEKVIGAGVNTRRAVHIEWDGVDRTTAWRFGLASAVAVDLPKNLLDGLAPHVQAWRARAPLLSPEARLSSAKVAAALGVFSNSSLVDLYSQIGDDEGDAGPDTAAARLRAAYVGGDDDARMKALRSLWGEAPAGIESYATSILTARAAVGIKPDGQLISDAAKLVGSMFSAGLDLQASRWAGVVNAGGDNADQAWAMLAVGAPQRVVDLSYGRIDGYGNRAGSDGKHRVQLLLAALGGLGRLSAADEAKLAGAYDLPIAFQNSFTRMIDDASQKGSAGTVALLGAVGMQTTSWGAVPPIYLYHIIAALRRVGEEPAARMIAAEAIARS